MIKKLSLSRLHSMILDVKTLPIVSIVAISSGYFVGSLTYNKLDPQQVQWETLASDLRDSGNKV